MRVALLASVLLLCAPARAAETIIIPVQDLLFMVPDFDNAPDFNMSAALQGNGNIIGNPKKESKRQKEKQEKALLRLVEEMYPDATVRLWRGNFIIRIEGN